MDKAAYACARFGIAVKLVLLSVHKAGPQHVDRINAPLKTWAVFSAAGSAAIKSRP